MENIRMNLYQDVADKLSAAPESAAKSELLDELTDNLYQRYLDMVAGGMEEQAAYEQAMDDLGDVEELVSYLNSLEPDQPLPDPEQAGKKSGGLQLDGLLKDVEDIVKGALSRAKSAIREVRDTLSEKGEAVWNAADSARQSAEEEGPTGEEAARPKGWEFSVGFDSGKGEFFAGGAPKTEDDKDVAYGLGYDKNKGGFYAQWGEYKGRYSRPVEDGPVDAEMLKGIDVQTVSGNVTIRMTEEPDGDVVIDGKEGDLEVRRSDDGVLTIRQGRTASAAFFFGRGLSTADVTLYLPCRRWEFLRIATISGDVTVDGDSEVGLLTVKTTSGDLGGGLALCQQLDFKSISGDMTWRGNVGQLQSGTTSGDVEVRGRLGNVQTGTTSGDVELDGDVAGLHCTSTSGDVTVKTGILPERMELSSRSGDCVAHIPDCGPFTVSYRTVSGSFRSDFFPGYKSGREDSLNYHEGGPLYRFTSTSGDLRLKHL